MKFTPNNLVLEIFHFGVILLFPIISLSAPATQLSGCGSFGMGMKPTVVVVRQIWSNLKMPTIWLDKWFKNND